MAKTSTSAENAALAREKKDYKKSLRRQLIGAAVVFCITLVLWKIGDPIAPQDEILQELPPLENVFSGQQGLDEAPQDTETEEIFDKLDSVIADIKGTTLPDDEYDVVEEQIEETPAAAEEETTAIEEVAEDIETVETAEVVETATTAETATDTTADNSEAQPPAQEEKPAAAGSGVKYFVQVGAFSKHQLAQAVQKKLELNKFSVRIQPITRSGKKLWRVQAINFPTQQSAQQGKEKLAALGYKDAQIKTEAAQ